MPRRRAAIQAIATLRRHSRECRNLETRELLLAVERSLVQLIDLERPDGLAANDPRPLTVTPERWAAE